MDTSKVERRKYRRKFPWIIIFTSLVLILTIGNTVNAQDELPPVPQDEVNAVAKQLYCPVCENIPLDVCPTQACEEWRELIRLKLSEGWSDDQIKDYFVEQYGDRVLASPPASGFNWLVYVIPPIAIILGLFLLYKSYKSMLSDKTVVVEPEGPDSTVPAGHDTGQKEEYIKRLEDELSRR